MKKILANDGLEKSGITLLESKGFNVITEKVAQENLSAYLNEHQIEVLLVRSATKVRKDLIDHCPNLKIIGRGGVGMDNIDVEYAQSKGIKVINTPAASSQSVAELVFSHLFTISRMLHESNRKMPSEGQTQFNELKKKFSKGFELSGKTIGIIGFGRIGQAAAKIAMGIGMKVLPYDPVVKSTEIELDLFHTDDTFSIQFDTVTLDELFSNSDIITLHVPMPMDGKPVIGNEQFLKMKKGVIVINTARGGIIDEAALLSNLNSGHVSFAGLDVFENEPTPRKELLDHPNISLSPHIGGSTIEAQDRIGTELADKIISFYS